MKFCSNCSKQLAGKQRKYCSDRCKMRTARGAKRNDVTDKSAKIGENNEPFNVFSTFGNEALPLTSAAKRALLQHLTYEAKYSDLWVKRLLSMPDLYDSEAKIAAQQMLSKILWRLVDDLNELEVKL